jgi:CDP-diacylglycerol--serine O-phosphatidyltransferase
MKKINFIPNIVTAFGLACGLYVIFKANLTGIGTYEFLHQMTLVLLLACLADVLDGALARAIKAESEFGLIFDSLADAISFGVAPSVLLLKSLALEQGTVLSFFALAAAMLFTVCGVLRLGRFNVRAKQVKGEDKKVFLGLPIPAAAICVVAPNLFLNSPLIEKFFPTSELFQTLFLSSIAIIIAYLMVSRIKFTSKKAIHLQRPFSAFRYLFLGSLLAITIFYGLFYYLAIFLLIVSWGYLVTSLLIAFGRTLTKKKLSRTKRVSKN